MEAKVELLASGGENGVVESDIEDDEDWVVVSRDQVEVEAKAAEHQVAESSGAKFGGWQDVALGGIVAATGVGMAGLLLSPLWLGSVTSGPAGLALRAASHIDPSGLHPKTTTTLKTVFSSVVAYGGTAFTVVKFGPEYWSKVWEREPPAHLIPYLKSALVVGRPIDSLLILVSGESDLQVNKTMTTLFDDYIFIRECDASNGGGNNGIPLFKKKIFCEIAGKDMSADVHVAKVCNNSEASVLKNEVLLINLLARANASIMKYPEKSSTYYNAIDNAGLLKVREQAYPNLVLVLVTAAAAGENNNNNNNNNNNMGQMSPARFTDSLMILSDTIDRVTPNLLVVVTNCLALGTEEATFKENFSQFCKSLRSAGEELLGLKDFPIIPIEVNPETNAFIYPTTVENNQAPQAADDEAIARPQQLQLPNGETTPKNLRTEIKNCLKRNLDRRAHLLLATYFSMEPEMKWRKDFEVVQL